MVKNANQLVGKITDLADLSMKKVSIIREFSIRQNCPASSIILQTERPNSNDSFYATLFNWFKMTH